MFQTNRAAIHLTIVFLCVTLSVRCTFEDFSKFIFPESYQSVISLTRPQSTDYFGQHGEIDEYLPTNTPGARGEVISTHEVIENSIVVIGGEGYIPYCKKSGTRELLNDVWVFNVSMSMWKWSGGTDGTTKESLFPSYSHGGEMIGGRCQGGSAVIPGTNELLIYGGEGYDITNTTENALGDVWLFRAEPEVNFTFIGGSKLGNCRGSYGEIGVENTTNLPPCRFGPVVLATSDRNMLIFSGLFNYTLAMSDLWFFDYVDLKFMWISGARTGNEKPRHGEKGVFHASNTPGARSFSNHWKMGERYFVFTGLGTISETSSFHDDQENDIKTPFFYLSDLFEWNSTSGYWRWLEGSKHGNADGLFVKNGGYPGSRLGGCVVPISQTQFVLIGGHIKLLKEGLITKHVIGNDVWLYSLASKKWDFLYGKNKTVENKYSRDNLQMGSRMVHMCGQFSSNSAIFVFGGVHENLVQKLSYLNDIWSIDVHLSRNFVYFIAIVAAVLFVIMCCCFICFAIFCVLFTQLMQKNQNENNLNRLFSSGRTDRHNSFAEKYGFDSINKEEISDGDVPRRPSTFSSFDISPNSETSPLLVKKIQKNTKLTKVLQGVLSSKTIRIGREIVKSKRVWLRNENFPGVILGRGVTSIVLLCEIKNREYAFKKNNNNDVKQVHEELCFLARFNHRNIVKVYAWCDTPFVGLILEKLTKIELDDIKQMTFIQKVKILYDVAQGMLFLHRVGVLHRDLKWPNVLLSNSGVAKITDFGISKRDKYHFSNLKDHTGKIIGTKWFVDPRIFCEKPYNYSADVFSYAIMIYTILFERFRLNDVYYEPERLYSEFAKDPSKMLDLRPKIPDNYPKEYEWLIELMKDCWMLDVEKRPRFTEIIKIIEQNSAIDFSESRGNLDIIDQEEEEGEQIGETEITIPEIKEEYIDEEPKEE